MLAENGWSHKITEAEWPAIWFSTIGVFASLVLSGIFHNIALKVIDGLED
jgi:hypothetical protein